MRQLFVAFSLALTVSAAAEDYTVTRFAGPDAGYGSVDADGASARFTQVVDVAAGPDGSVYAVDAPTHTIRRMTAAGVVSTVAGLAGVRGFVDGPGGAARFSDPADITIDPSGNLYVADRGNLAIRRISPEGIVSTFASTPWGVHSLDVDRSGHVYATGYDQKIHRITPAAVESVVGQHGYFRIFGDIVVDAVGNLFFVENSRVEKMVAGSHFHGTFWQFSETPNALAVLPSTGMVLVARGRQLVRLTEDAYGYVSPATIAGSGSFGDADGPALSARFKAPTGLAVAASGDIFISDASVPAIRKLSAGSVSTVAGSRTEYLHVDGDRDTARFSWALDAVADSQGNVFIADSWRIRKITPAGEVTTFAGPEIPDGAGGMGWFDKITALAIDGDDTLYACDTRGGSNGGRVYKITPDAVVTTLAGSSSGGGLMDGIGQAALFFNPEGLTLDASGNVYVADRHAIRRVTPEGVVTTLAGSTTAGSFDGIGSAARFDTLMGIDSDASGNLYVADLGNATIRRVTPAGEVTTFAGAVGQRDHVDGTGSAARFSQPVEVEVDDSGNVWLLDYGLLRRITPAGAVTTIAGSGFRTGNMPGTGSIARFQFPSGLGFDKDGNLYVTDEEAGNVRVVKVAGIEDIATASSLAPALHSPVTLGTAPDTATSWEWTVLRRPPGSIAGLSSSTVRNPTFTPDAAGLYVIRLRAEGAAGVRYSVVEITPAVTCEPLGSVVASVTGSATVCEDGTGGTAALSIQGGVDAIQWAWRAAGSSDTHPIAGATMPTYVVRGEDLGDVGVKELVAVVTSSCGVAVTSNPIAVTVIATPPALPISVSSGVYANETNNFASVDDAGASATYEWSITNGTIVSGQGTRSIRYAAGASGHVSLSVTVTASCRSTAQADVPILTRAAGASMLYLVNPCRVLDTRDTGRRVGSSETLNVQVTGRCGVPAGAKALALNVTAVAPVSTGFATLWRAGWPRPDTSTINYRPGRTRANNAAIELSPEGSLHLFNLGGSTHFLIDVTGYFQ